MHILLSYTHVSWVILQWLCSQWHVLCCLFMFCSIWASWEWTAEHNVWTFRFQIAKKERTHFLPTGQKVLVSIAVVVPSLDSLHPPFAGSRTMERHGRWVRPGRTAVLECHHIHCGLAYGLNMRFFPPYSLHKVCSDISLLKVALFHQDALKTMSTEQLKILEILTLSLRYPFGTKQFHCLTKIWLIKVYLFNNQIGHRNSLELEICVFCPR